MGCWNIQENLDSDLFWASDDQFYGGFPPFCVLAPRDQTCQLFKPTNCIFWGASFKPNKNLAILVPGKLQGFYRTLLYHCYTLVIVAAYLCNFLSLYSSLQLHHPQTSVFISDMCHCHFKSWMPYVRIQELQGVILQSILDLFTVNAKLINDPIKRNTTTNKCLPHDYRK